LTATSSAYEKTAMDSHECREWIAPLAKPASSSARADKAQGATSPNRDPAHADTRATKKRGAARLPLLSASLTRSARMLKLE
jgi:hypothetical protein